MSRAMTLVVASVCLFSALQQTPVSAQSTSSKIFMVSMIREWVKLAASHRAGEADAAARTVSDWQAADLMDLFGELKQLKAFKNKWVEGRDGSSSFSLSPCPGCSSFWSKQKAPTLTREVVMSALGVREEEVLSPVFTRLLLRSALLHTDAAVLTAPVAKRPGTTSPFTGMQTVVSRDGQQTGAGDATWHLEFAAFLLDGVWPDVSADERARGWYDAAVVHLLRVSWIGEADWLLGRGVARFPDDARLSFLRGTVNETFAMPVHQQARQGTRMMPAESHLNVASAFFERALVLDPDLAEARLHAGRVASLLAKHDDAASDLRRVAFSIHDPDLQYYASLFLGVEQEAAGDMAGARASYDRANHLFPGAPSPLLALSALARRQSDSVEALASVRRLLELPKQPGRQEDDPWWRYEFSHVRDADQRLAEWRARLSDGAAR